MKKRRCRKCGALTYVDKHHILPKNIFGKHGETVDLCPNCHSDYHQELGYKNLKNPDMKYHFRAWYKWFYWLPT